MKILIGITGGIAAYKTLDIISILQKKGHDVHVIMSDNAHNFVTGNAVNVISKENLKTETPDQTIHIKESKWCDVFILVPATANTIAKVANGIAGSFLLSTILAISDEKIHILCPAMNTNMWENRITQRNIDVLKSFNWKIINPVEGMLACNDFGIGKLPSPKEIVDKINKIINPIPYWISPIHSTYKGATIDSFSFLDYDWSKEFEINLFPHVGSFGVRRRHDIHKGIDLYAEEGTYVYAVESGVVVDICWFTGEKINQPWWENTKAVYIKGKSGIVVYGEIDPNIKLSLGDSINIGDFIGTVKRVLKKDNHRPLSMLHLELHEHDYIHTGQWKIGQPKPDGIIDPTPYLLNVFNK
jgi:hypothetical protein